ncbi:uncharacterized protein LOC111602069 [Drosophila hydei]|uniref:Uncharacterized protein LOC111602069 n=1 Tax=Drosophila hydei TaxID=7224 RepID=A0A6J1M8H9_DROHY|nr:uncharacterized protein LOC111602069 [Drosophila hydei]
MCAPCRVGCCNSHVGRCRPPLEKLRPVEKYRWFRHCTADSCAKCRNNVENDYGDEDDLQCDCVCRRNRHIIEALSCLFKCSVQYMVSLLFKLAYQQLQPLKRFPRDRVWNVMEHVKAPYTELNDLEIYDSMYDRCGLPIDPLDTDNIIKIIRLMFLTKVLTSEQHKYLMHMLQRLNEHAYCPVHLDLLLQTLETLDLKKLVCGIRNQEELTRRLYTSRQCSSICKLYRKVTTVDKHMVSKNRSRRRHKYKMSNNETHVDDGSSVRHSALNRQFCERKPNDNIADITPPANTIRSVPFNRSSNAGTRNMRNSSVVNPSNKRHYPSAEKSHNG